MIIGSITDGIVIDHIPAGKSMQLYKQLQLEDIDSQVAIIKNAVSKKQEKKDILKINSIIDLNYTILGYIDPNITVNIIKNGHIVKKFHPELPEKITGILHCKNPRCITSVEQELEHVFQLTDKEKRIYRCIYCDTIAE